MFSAERRRNLSNPNYFVKKLFYFSKIIYCSVGVTKLRGFARCLLPNEGAIYHKDRTVSRFFSQRMYFFTPSEKPQNPWRFLYKMDRKGAFLYPEGDNIPYE